MISFIATSKDPRVRVVKKCIGFYTTFYGPINYLTVKPINRVV